MPGYKSLDAAYNSGFEACANGEPNNLWSPYATEEEAELWRHGWSDANNMRIARERWDREVRAFPTYDPRIDYPERYTDGKPV